MNCIRTHHCKFLAPLDFRPTCFSTHGTPLREQYRPDVGDKLVVRVVGKLNREKGSARKFFWIQKRRSRLLRRATLSSCAPRNDAGRFVIANVACATRRQPKAISARLHVARGDRRVDPTGRLDVADHRHAPRRDRLHEIVEDLVRHGLMKCALVPVRPQVHLE